MAHVFVILVVSVTVFCVLGECKIHNYCLAAFNLNHVLLYISQLILCYI